MRASNETASPPQDGRSDASAATGDRAGLPGASAFKPGRWRLLRPLSLSWLLSLLTLAILAPFLALAAYSLLTRVERAEAEEIRRIEGLAVDLSLAVDRELEAQMAVTRVLTGARALQRGDIEAFAELAEDAALHAEGHFILIDRSYQQLVNTRVPLGEPLPTAANQEAVDRVFATGEAHVGDLREAAVARRVVFSLDLPVPVEGEVRYVLSFVPDRDVIQGVVEQAYRPAGWQASVIDANGLIVARSRRHEEFFGQPVTPEILQGAEQGGTGKIETVDLEGNDAVTVYSTSAISGWKSFVWAPEALLREPAVAVQGIVARILLLALAASVLFAYLLAHLIRRPALRVLAATDALAAGQPVTFQPSIMREANIVGHALADASRAILLREAELRDAEERRRVLMQEMSHRAKNMLTVIQAIAAQSGRKTSDFGTFRIRFQERLAGLARSQDLLVHKGGAAVALDELIRSHIGAFIEPSAPRLQLHGPQLSVGPEAAQNIGMAVHELSTNALKHGSLSVPGGKVTVEWEFRQEDPAGECLHLRWIESDGPAPKNARRRSFGSLVLERIVPEGLQAKAATEMRPTGLVWSLKMPMTSQIIRRS